jgi:hypothetical protein
MHTLPVNIDGLDGDSRMPGFVYVFFCMINRLWWLLVLDACPVLLF